MDNTIGRIGFCHSWCEPSRNLQFTRAQLSLITSVRGFIQCSCRQAVHLANGGLLQCNNFNRVLKTAFSEKYVTEFQESKTYKYDGPYICENDVAAPQDLFGNYPLTKERGDETRGFKRPVLLLIFKKN